jgi:hypothetical protein
MFRVRRTAPLSRVEYAIRERERKKRKKKRKNNNKWIFSHAITFFDFHHDEQKKKKVIEKNVLFLFFALNFTAVDNLYVAKFDYIEKLNLSVFFFSY